MLEIKAISAAQSHPLRAAVLRPGLPLARAQFPDDDTPGTRHFGAYLDGELVGTGFISPIREPADIEPGGGARGGYQLRGMSVASSFRGRSIGAQVLRACIQAARATGAPVLWCNARVRAVELYRRQGFISVGERFEIAGIGPHLRMRLKL